MIQYNTYINVLSLEAACNINYNGSTTPSYLHSEIQKIVMPSDENSTWLAACEVWNAIK